ncbi:MAG TPA: CDP-alcohol phosphatidyltransferase family protein [Chitinophagaceae bacterium]|nr:CDP-alcohol phosphatidyltransferase family protein [Chitinophagaceae bacterium]
MKQIPNIFTLLNLFLGCVAIIYIVQPGLAPVFREVNPEYLAAGVNNDGTQYVSVPEQAVIGSILIGAAAVVDFLDGFVARLFKATSDIGKQLDSLADVVSFGVAPGMIIYEFLRMSVALQTNGLDAGIIWLLPAFIVPCAGAYRLARFNIDTRQVNGFKGVPIPAAGLLIASFPLIYWFSGTEWITGLFTNKWFWYGIIIIASWLMVSTLPMMALKFKNFSLQDNWPKLLLAIVAIIAAIFLQWLAVPLVFVVYVLLSLLLKLNVS